MIEHVLLLNTATPLLLLWFAARHPLLAVRMQRRGFALLCAGALAPLLDLPLAYVLSADRIGMLLQPPRLGAPYYGGMLVLVVAVLHGFVVGPRKAAVTAGWLGGGLVLHWLPALLTPAGVALGSPFDLARFALPFLPVGHAPLLVLGLLALGIERLSPVRRRAGWITLAVLGALYPTLALAQFGAMQARVADLRAEWPQVQVLVDDDWATRWRVVATNSQSYAIVRARVTDGTLEDARKLPRWNDEPRLMKLLADPVVLGFFQRVFEHPVVRVEVTGNRLTLLMRELRHHAPVVPGMTFNLESDLSGRDRLYQVRRFN